MQPGFWRKCRVGFRWFRIATLLAALVAICMVLWFNRVGLPDFLKNRIVAELHEHGFDLEFSRMRLSFIRGLVADKVRLRHAQSSGAPTLSLEQVQLELNFHALLLRQLLLNGLVLRGGKLTWAVSQTNELSLENIQTDLQFWADDTWSLDNFHAEFAGARLNLSGKISHAQKIRGWEIFQRGKPTNAPPQLQKFLDALARIHFSGEPQLSLVINGDAQDSSSFAAELSIAQGRTWINLDGRMADAAGNCRWRLHGALEPEFARPLLAAAKVSRALDILTFKNPVFLDVNGRGRLPDFDSIGANGQLALTNFMVRGESFGEVKSEMIYTNRVLQLLNPLMHTRAQMMSADSVTFDFNTRLLFFTNGFSSADPESIARAIGPHTGRIVEPYHFLEPPGARVNGQIPLRDLHGGPEMAAVDMTFDVVNGAPFQWLKFRTTNVTGIIHWQGTKLFVTNVVAAFYEGSGSGFANFDFQVPHEGADYDFAVNVENANLHWLAADLSSPATSLEGTLDGRLVVTRADTRDWRTWNGHGDASLRDGLIWEIPLFGIFSPALNTVRPGLGNSRATGATAEFSITNGLIYTDSLEIRSTMTRLQYVGTMDMSQKINARVTAQLLRDNISVLGPLVSTMLWPVSKLFEYKVSGTLKNPVSEPVHAPTRLLLMPLHPIRSLEEIFPAGTFTNAPVEK